MTDYLRDGFPNMPSFFIDDGYEGEEGMFVDAAPNGIAIAGVRRAVEYGGRARHEIEEAFMDDFEGLVPAIDFRDVMVVPEGNKVDNPEQFRFVPLIGHKGVLPLPYSMSEAGEHVKVPEGIRCTYDKGRPYLDTARAIGLVNGGHEDGDWLIALASMGIDTQGRLRIVQIQDVTDVRSRIKVPDGERMRTVSNWPAFTSTGLRSGFMWRDTLVSASEKIACALGISDVVVMSHLNSRWESVQEKGIKGYDMVAQRMGYRIETPNCDWVKRVLPLPGDMS
jgi:hypothetical protein